MRNTEQFAVSLVYALIAGNASIIRVSDKEFEQVDILCKAINELLEHDYKTLVPYINVIRYGNISMVSLPRQATLATICPEESIATGTLENSLPIVPKSEGCTPYLGFLYSATEGM